jgi:hypothetical protein
MFESSATRLSAAPLRVVLLVDALQLPRWAADTVAAMAADPRVHLVGVLLNGRAAELPDVVSQRGFPRRLANAWRKRDNILLDRYYRFDSKRYPPIGSDPFAGVDVSEWLGSAVRITAHPRQTAFSDFIEDEALTQVRVLRPDVAVRFGFRILRGKILTIPTYGVWSFHHGDNFVNRGGPAGVWEVLLGWSATGAVLQRLSEDLDGGATLSRTWVATETISVARNRASLYRSAAPLLMRKVQQLAAIGPAAMLPPAMEPAFVPYSNRLFVSPTASELARGCLGIAARLVKRKWATLRRFEQWQIAYGTDVRQEFENTAPQTSMFRFKRLVPPRDRFWADPFAVVADGRHYIFLEELLYAEEKGRIAVVEIVKNAPVGEPRVVLELPYHLSYPFVFSYEGQWYMMPEMSRHGVQEVYRATAFPDQWEHFRSLELGQPVADATIVEHEGRWWLFAATRAHAQLPFNELSLFYSDTPLGPWQAHAMNPVLSDARSARPAGRLFRRGVDLIRPAQDGTPSYGAATVFKRVRRLDTEGYAEEAIGRIDPAWAPDVAGTHTVNAAGQLTVIDARVSRQR